MSRHQKRDQHYLGQGSAGDVQTIGRRERGRNGEGRKSEEGGSYGRKSGTKGAVPMQGFWQ